MNNDPTYDALKVSSGPSQYTADALLSTSSEASYNFELLKPQEIQGFERGHIVEPSLAGSLPSNHWYLPRPQEVES